MPTNEKISLCVWSTPYYSKKKNNDANVEIIEPCTSTTGGPFLFAFRVTSVSSAVDNPLRSVLTSNVTGFKNPARFFPKGCPCVHPIFCNSRRPTPSRIGFRLLKKSYIGNISRNYERNIKNGIEMCRLKEKIPKHKTQINAMITFESK